MPNNNEIPEFTAALIAFSEAAQPILDSLAQFFTSTIEVFRVVYRNNGSPFGDTEEGFLHWLEMLNNKLPDRRRYS